MKEVGVLQILPMFIRPGLVFLLIGCCLAQFHKKGGGKEVQEREEKIRKKEAKAVLEGGKRGSTEV